MNILFLVSCTYEEKECVETDYSNIDISPEELAIYDKLPNTFFQAESNKSSELILLGRKLFNEKLLSKNKDVSCNSCHPLSNGGVDGLRFSIGSGGTITSRNSPTVFNAAGNTFQFWDGRSPNVEEQALGPILSANEMGMLDEASVISSLKINKEYDQAFSKAFPSETEPLNLKNIGIAIGAYERTLLTPSRWDLFLEGDNDALSKDEKDGLVLFNKLGCGGCHNGPMLGGQTFMKLGLANEWENQTDAGRYQITGLEKDFMFFKIASLRNVSVTAPYFHDGSAKDLSEAIKLMGHHQLGKEITDNDAILIESWLSSTTGVLINE